MIKYIMVKEKVFKEKIFIGSEVREYLRALGKRQGTALRDKRGSEYFKRISAMRKTFGPKVDENSAIRIAMRRYDISRQRIYQILKKEGPRFDRASYETLGAWREAVLKDYFTNSPYFSKIRARIKATGGDNS